ncbi:MAG: anthranilate/aminodeoxychorismate synthase component II, partial [Deltaproteobacteria bacterium]|nr:anthranilate/aminodeoxychorismate synthase component II [Deltaproteobacteria bacterium]
AFGATIVRAKRLMHGKTSPIIHDGKTIFKGIDNPFVATRYHSLVIERKTIPGDFEISAWTEEGEVMGIRHRKLMVEGVQFHPESILTKAGKDILKNFLVLSEG